MGQRQVLLACTAATAALTIPSPAAAESDPGAILTTENVCESFTDDATGQVHEYCLEHSGVKVTVSAPSGQEKVINVERTAFTYLDAGEVVGFDEMFSVFVHQESDTGTQVFSILDKSSSDACTSHLRLHMVNGGLRVERWDLKCE